MNLTDSMDKLDSCKISCRTIFNDITLQTTFRVSLSLKINDSQNLNDEPQIIAVDVYLRIFIRFSWTHLHGVSATVPCDGMPSGIPKVNLTLAPHHESPCALGDRSKKQ